MAGICAVQAAATLADSEVSIHLPQIVSFDMAPKKRSEAQLAAARRGTSTKKNKAAKKQHVDTNAAVDTSEGERALSRALLRAAWCRACSDGSHRAPLPDDYHFELPDPSTTATQGSRRRTSSRRPTPKVRSRCQAELGNPPACLSRVCPCSLSHVCCSNGPDTLQVSTRAFGRHQGISCGQTKCAQAASAVTRSSATCTVQRLKRILALMRVVVHGSGFGQ